MHIVNKPWSDNAMNPIPVIIQDAIITQPPVTSILGGPDKAWEFMSVIKNK